METDMRACCVSQREQEVFACMIHNLFDEYRFFPRYPERELLITGRLFGSLIQHHLVSSITLGIALRYVLEALRKPLRSNMFKFGMCALEQFKQRLVEWPQYCHHILQITHVRQAHEELINYIQEALSSSRPAGVAPDGTQPTQMSQQGVPLSQPLTLAGPANGGPAIAAAPVAAPLQAAKAPGAPAAPGAVLQQPIRMPQQPAPAGVKPDGMSGQPAVSAGQRPAGYGAFEGAGGQGGQDMNSFAGFSEGFGQQGSSQLPSNLQNLASDSGSESAQERVATVEMSPGVQQTLSVLTGSSAFGAPTNIDKLLLQAREVSTPDSQLQDKIHFIFNNLSNTNLEAKEKELTSAMSAHGDEYIPWLSQYIVIKRAAQESNYHSLYLSMIDRLERSMKPLIKDVIATTIDNIKILLEDDNIKSSSSLRSLLKNLGSWLGSLTLQKNKPILQMSLDFKRLLMDAFEKGKLVAVVPFVAKVLDSAMSSRIFRPPNPWTMMVLGILAELHPMADLKLNIKFEVRHCASHTHTHTNTYTHTACSWVDTAFVCLLWAYIHTYIHTHTFNRRWVVQLVYCDMALALTTDCFWQVEVLCKNLNQELKEIKSSICLKDIPVSKDSNPDWTSRNAAASLAALRPIPTVVDQRLMAAAAGLVGGSLGGGTSLSGMSGSEDKGTGLMPNQQGQGAQSLQQQQLNQDLANVNVSQFVIINPSIMIFQQHPHLVQMVSAGINQAIKDIIAPVVERSVTIALITSRELILKDFV
jgi:CCR4-NOT transcription complex subunit 1